MPTAPGLRWFGDGGESSRRHGSTLFRAGRELSHTSTSAHLDRTEDNAPKWSAVDYGRAAAAQAAPATNGFTNVAVSATPHAAIALTVPTVPTEQAAALA